MMLSHVSILWCLHVPLFYGVCTCRYSIVFAHVAILRCLHVSKFFGICTCRSELTVAPQFKDSINKIPSLSQTTLAMTLAEEVCGLNLFPLILTTAPI
jgi:hypothetical protein